MMKRTIATLISLLTLMMGLSPVSEAASADVLKVRMTKRLGQLVSLKQKGSVGENNQGYLTARGSLSGSESALVKAENVDRRAVYQIIATKTKSSVGNVGKARAKSIRSSAPKGTWVQLPNGKWEKA